jgi:DNA-binding CsgD family transcriptional regulator
MQDRLGIGTKDLQRLCAVTDKAHLSGTDRVVPRSVLEALRDLVPCDEITYLELDPASESIDMREFAGTTSCLEPDVTRFRQFFWHSFWSSPACSYPEQTGDFTSVRRATDFFSGSADFAASEVFELFRVQGVRYNVLLPLAPDRGVGHRIELWRVDGPDFSERELLLLSLLRPALAELDLSIRGRHSSAPLTSRQLELLELVAEGMTNRQIARRLVLSEGTVRRHLENVYARIGVTNRAAAASYLGRIRNNNPTSRSNPLGPILEDVGTVPMLGSERQVVPRRGDSPST